MAACFIAWNSATGALTGPPSTAASSATSGTAKTMLQIRPPSSSKIKVIEWGYSFDVVPANVARVELVETGTVYATVTAHVSGGIVKYNDASGGTSSVQLGTTHTGYTATAEGSITASRLLGYNYENGLYFKQQFPLGREPEVGADCALRLRVTPTSAAALNVSCYVVWEE